MPALNYATEYQRELEQAFPYALYFGALYATPNNGRYKWDSADTIKIPRISTTGRTDANRDVIGQASRNYNNSWETLTLSNERSWTTLVHPRDIDETNQAASIANITRVYNEEQKFPEMDAYTASKIYADWTAAGRTAHSEALDAETILNVIDAMLEDMTEHRVPKIGNLLYCIPHVYTMIKNAKDIVRNLDATKRNALNRAIVALDEMEIVEVPSELMKTLYDFTSGWAVADNADQIDFMIINPLAVITPVSYEFAKLDEPNGLSQGKYVYYEESHEDVFVLKNKLAAIQMHVTAHSGN